ncbi:MAG: IS110 family transposase [Candidatus Micrarchaeota archaeon]|nr:IS110 family transposase [Candidatus Micrarchaeota archaeon]MDE1848367.1 IS110 family transposase [Candidatus Micrarchaeota archaeon]MDE1864574.1 IS110 family transposase [Candidatus Micrarchaeota archaeon]
MERDICRNRQFLVEKRTALKNRIRHMMFQYEIEFKNFNKKNNRKLDANPILKILREELEYLDRRIGEFNTMIEKVAYQNHYARLIYTIPGIGRVGALTLASEIADVKRFSNEGKIFSYAGLVPRVYQSGEKEWRGHIHHGNNFIKRILVECVQIHIRVCQNSPISAAYRRIKIRAGHNKAKIAAARRMLRIIYYMLMRDESYHPNE